MALILDSSLSHISKATQTFLGEKVPFFMKTVIGPSNSPDLNHFDYFFVRCASSKDKCFATPKHQECIMRATRKIKKAEVGTAAKQFRSRMESLNKSWWQHPTRQQLYGHLPPITKTIQVRRTRHAGHCWRSRSELISDVLQLTPTYGRAKAGRPARTYIQQLCEDTGCSPEDRPEAMNDKKWRERVMDIHACGTT